MIVTEARALTSPQKLEPFGQQVTLYPPGRRFSMDRECKSRRASADFTDLAALSEGTKVDLNGLLANAFSLDLDREMRHELPLKSKAAAAKDKGERRLLPKLPSLKRRRRCYALHLLAGPEGNSNESGL